MEYFFYSSISVLKRIIMHFSEIHFCTLYIYIFNITQAFCINKNFLFSSQRQIDPIIVKELYLCWHMDQMLVFEGKTVQKLFLPKKKKPFEYQSSHRKKHQFKCRIGRLIASIY